MASLRSQPVKCLNTLSSSGKRFVFKTFSQRVEEIEIDVYRSLDPVKSEPSNGSSFFREELLQWRELNTTEHFISFYEEMLPWVQTLPQILLHKEKMFSELLCRVQMNAQLSLEPILRLVAALSRDILEEFLPFFPRLAGTLVDLLKDGGEREPEILEQKYLTKDVVHILRITMHLRYYHKDYVQEFMAESISFLLRNTSVEQLEKGSDTAVEVATDVIQRLCEALPSKHLDLLWDRLSTEIYACIKDGCLLHMRRLLALLTFFVRFSSDGKIPDCHSILKLVNLLIEIYIIPFGNMEPEDQSDRVIAKILQLILCLLDSPVIQEDFPIILQQWAPIFHLKNSRLITFIRGLLLKDPAIPYIFQSHIMSAMDDLIGASPSEVLYAMMSFFEKLQQKLTSSSGLIWTFEDKLPNTYNIAGVATYTWQSLIGAALTAYHKVLLDKREELAETSNFLTRAKKYKSSSHVLAAVADYLISVSRLIGPTDDNLKSFHPELGAEEAVDLISIFADNLALPDKAIRISTLKILSHYKFLDYQHCESDERAQKRQKTEGSLPCFENAQCSKSLQKIPDIAGSHSQQLIPLFFKFLGYSFDGTLRLELLKSNACKGKEWRLVLKEWLNLLRLMRHPQSLYGSQSLKDVLVNRLLDDSDPDVQMKVLDCLFNWKDDFLVPYEQHLRNLITLNNMREELTTWTLSRESRSIQNEHRAHPNTAVKQLRELRSLCLKIIYFVLSKKSIMSPEKIGIRIFKRLVKYIDEPLAAKQFVHIMLLFFQKKSLTSDECMEVLHVIKGILPVLDKECSGEILSAVHPLLISTVLDVRLFVCDILDGLALIDPSLAFLAKLLRGLNATSALEMGEVDFDARVNTYEAITQELFISLREEHALVILSHCVHDMSSEELILRQCASKSLLAFVRFAAMLLDNETKDNQNEEPISTGSWTKSRVMNIIKKVLLRNIGKAMGKEISVQKEWIAFLRDIVVYLPGVSILRNLIPLHSVDPEKDFFFNILHLQRHKRAKALSRFRDVVSSGNIAEDVLKKIFIPLFFNMLVGIEDGKGEHIRYACVETLASIAAQMQWESYHAFLMRCFREATLKPEKQKILLRLICVVLDVFHFSESICTQESTGCKISDSVSEVELCVPTDIQSSLQNTVLPCIQKLLGSNPEKVDVNITVASLKVLKLLPKDTMESQLPTILHRVSNFLKNPLISIRDEARSALAECGKELGLARLHMDHVAPKTKTKLEMMLHHIALGIGCNPSVDPTDLFVFVYGIIEDHITEENLRAASEIRIRVSQSSYLITVFALGLLHRHLKKIKLDKKDEHLLSILDPFVKLLGSCLNSKYKDILSATFKCLAPLTKLPLPSLENEADRIKMTLLDIVQKSGSTSTTFMHSCLKLLTVLLRSTQISLSDDQMRMLIQFPLFIDIQTNPSFIALSLLKAIVDRKLIVHEIYDVVTQVAELMVTSQLEPIRRKCSQILMRFLLDYHLSEKRLQQHLDFLLTNLRYEHSSGRESVLEMLHVVIIKFPKTIVDSQAQTFFLHLVLSLLVEVLGKQFHEHVRMVLQVAKHIMASALDVSVKQEQEQSNRTMLPFWKEAYYSLSMFAKMLIHFPELYADKLDAQLTDTVMGESITQNLSFLIYHLHSMVEGVSINLHEFCSALDSCEQDLLYEAVALLGSREARDQLLNPTSSGQATDRDLQSLLIVSLLKRMGKIAVRRENIQMKIIFNCFQRISTKLGSGGCQKYAIQMLLPLYKVCEGFAGKVIPDDIKQLAEEARQSIKEVIGQESFLQLYNTIRKNQKEKREGRKQEEKVIAAVDPMRHAKRKLRISAKRQANKKRKITTMKMGRWMR
ncbi:hypothetical protein QJS04_geneDACA000746 [Acorus gramineus]|uniref:Small subunit processome component 20 homolog n=1 Tax=Acorus gramineus TaxID=55184 RepID=A0AAV9BKW3_ACOGR|nr:hypothetical protein QJS04_geneDACA000746 [Acorus gramineus]